MNFLPPEHPHRVAHDELFAKAMREACAKETDYEAIARDLEVISRGYQLTLEHTGALLSAAGLIRSMGLQKVSK